MERAAPRRPTNSPAVLSPGSATVDHATRARSLVVVVRLAGTSHPGTQPRQRSAAVAPGAGGHSAVRNASARST